MKYGDRAAEQRIAAREAAKIKGSALTKSELNKIKENVNVQFDLDALQQERLKLQQLMANAKGNGDSTYTNELAQKGGWQTSVVVHRDDSWKDIIKQISNTQTTIKDTLIRIDRSTMGE